MVLDRLACWLSRQCGHGGCCCVTTCLQAVCSPELCLPAAVYAYGCPFPQFTLTCPDDTLIERPALLVFVPAWADGAWSVLMQ